jgi:RNA polymerase sigma factor (sigma-70 family)
LLLLLVLGRMHGEQEFQAFIERIRKGDSSAAEELVRLYEPIVRRQVRMQMVDSRLSRLYDSVDFSQAVMASFFLRGSEFELQEPKDLVRLLVTMARNKLASSARRVLAQKRDGQRRDVDAPLLNQVADGSDTPSRIVSMLELIAEAKKKLTPEEQQLVDLRNDGKSWDEIAVELGGTAQARRMQLARAMERVTESLGMGP